MYSTLFGQDCCYVFQVRLFKKRRRKKNKNEDVETKDKKKQLKI